jgi:putative transcriptional regulator
MVNKNRSGIRAETTFGDEVLEGLNDFAESIKKGEPITIRDVTLELEPDEYDAEDVRVTRQKLGVSQAVFAKLLAVKVKTVQAWEQGDHPPSGIARRLLDEINQDLPRWLGKLKGAVTTKTRQTGKTSCPA